MAHDLYALIARSITEYADRPALVTPDGQTLTYRKVGQTIDAFSARASTEGIGPGQKIHIDIENYAVELCLMFALSRLGAMIVMGAEVREILEAKIALDAIVSIDLRANPRPRNILFDASWFSPTTNEQNWRGHGSNDDTVLIGASSGTTGKPKFMEFNTSRLIMRTTLRAGAFNQPDAMAYKKRLITLGVTTIVGFVMRVRSLQSGGLMVMPVPSARGTLELLRDLEIEEIFTVPTLAVEFLNALRRTPIVLPALQRMVIGGGAASRNICREIATRMDCEVIISFGSSEIGNIATGLFKENEAIEGAIGHLGPWIEGRAFDDAKQPLAPGEFGLLGFRVPAQMRVEGYLNSEPGQREVFRDGWFFPGDLGRIEADGLVVLSGRSSELINTGGNKIAPNVIEAMVAGKFGVVQAAALGIANEAGMDDICLALVGDGALDIAAVHAHMTEEFGSFVQVKIAEVKTMPANAGGNVDRRKLKDLF